MCLSSTALHTTPVCAGLTLTARPRSIKNRIRKKIEKRKKEKEEGCNLGPESAEEQDPDPDQLVVGLLQSEGKQLCNSSNISSSNSSSSYSSNRRRSKSNDSSINSNSSSGSRSSCISRKQGHAPPTHTCM